MPTNQDAILIAILSMVGRQAFPVNALKEILLSRGASMKQVKAFNMCDGTRSQSDIVKTLKLDPGNFSRTAARWMAEGILFKLGDGRDAKLLHIYPIPENAAGKARSTAK